MSCKTFELMIAELDDVINAVRPELSEKYGEDRIAEFENRMRPGMSSEQVDALWDEIMGGGKTPKSGYVSILDD